MNNNNDIFNSLTLLNPIDLDSIRDVSLMNRSETKYVLPASRISDLLEIVSDKYKVLEINNERSFLYRTSYLDTPDYLFYNTHVRGKLERHKIRYRIYESSGTSFLEIKRKTNKRRTIKYRIINTQSESLDKNAVSFIREHLNFNHKLLIPALNNSYMRATLVGLNSKERITIDYDISFSLPSEDRQAAMSYLAVVELKKDTHSSNSLFNTVIKKLNVHPTGFSKYCMGSAVLNDLLRKNMIKPKLLLLNKIENEYYISRNY